MPASHHHDHQHPTSGWGFPTCREVTYMTSLAQDAQLPWFQRLRWRVHLVLCAHCRRYYQQIRLLRQLLKKYARQFWESTANTDAQLSVAAKERLRAALQNENR